MGEVWDKVIHFPHSRSARVLGLIRCPPHSQACCHDCSRTSDLQDHIDMFGANEHLSSCMCVCLGVASSPRHTKASGSKWHLAGLGYIGTQKNHARIHTLQYPTGPLASTKYLCPSRLSFCIYCRVYIFLNYLHMCRTCVLFIRTLSFFKVYHH